MWNDESPRAASAVWRIGITGGIGSGKSYVCRQLEAAGHPVFYCDDEAKRIIRTDPAVRRELEALVGPGVYDARGQLVKAVLAAYLCRGRACAAQVDAVVHPRVAAAFRNCAARMAQAAAGDDAGDAARALFAPKPCGAGAAGRSLTVGQLAALPPGRVLFMECALLFESGFDRLVDSSVLVHVTAHTQLRRVMARDGVSADKARAWMALQLSEDERMRRADAYICND